MNETVKIKDKTTGAIKEVKKALAGDFIGTGNFELVDETKEQSKEDKFVGFSKESNK